MSVLGRLAFVSLLGLVSAGCGRDDFFPFLRPTLPALDAAPTDDATEPADADTGEGPDLALDAGPDTGVDGGPDVGPVDTGLDGGPDVGPLDTGVDGGFDGGLDTGVGIDGPRDTGVDTGIDGGLDTGVGIDGPRDTGVDTGVDGGRDTGVDTGVDGGRDTGVDTGVDGGRDTGVDTGVDGGPVDTGVDGGTPDAGGCAQVCSTLDTPCTQGRCNVTTGRCESVPFNEGRSCPAPNACSAASICRAGTCFSTAPVDCSALTTQCATGACDPMIGCVARPVANGAMCTDENACTLGDACQAGLCTPTSMSMPVATCTAPDIIPVVVPTPQSFGQSVVCQGDSLTPSCGNGVPTPDAVYSLTLDAPRVVFVTPAGTSTAGVLTVTSGTCGTSPELLCIAGAGGLEQALGELPPATYFIGSEEPGASPGFSVVIDPHDTCARPRIIPAIPNSTVQLSGTTRLANQDFTLTCGNSGGAPDHVYQLTLATTTAVDIRTRVFPGLPQFDTVLGIQSGGCGTGMIIACNDDTPGSTLSRIQSTLMAGTYFVVVDGFGVSQGAYTLEVTLGTPMSTGLIFPDTGDPRLSQNPPGFSRNNDFVEGVRTPSAAFNSAIDFAVTLQNNLSCDSADFAVLVGGSIVSRFTVIPGQTMQNISVAAFGPAGVPVPLRFELTRDVRMGCGFVGIPNGVSTVAFR